jgi:hypothetical protein
LPPEATYQDRHLLLLLVLSSHGYDWHAQLLTDMQNL